MSSLCRPLGQVLGSILARHASHAFGLMGNGNAHVIDGLRKAGVPFTAVRHEAATVAAADAYTRISGSLAIATATYGAGFTNTITALAEAAQARTPMLVVVGDEPTTGRRPWDVDLEMLSAAVGTRSYTIPLTDVAGTVDRAVAHARRARKPVVIAIPYDLVRADVPAATAQLAELRASVAGERPRPARPQPSISAAVEALAGAERPVVLAGAGAWRANAGPLLDEIAEVLGAPTASTALARGLFEDETAHLGITGGFGVDAAMQVIEDADVVLVVGASLNQFTMRFGELLGDGATLVRIDVDAVEPPSVASQRGIRHILIQGDGRDVLETLIEPLRRERPLPSTYVEVARRGQCSGSYSHREIALRDMGGDTVRADGRLDPRAVAIRIAELLPEDMIVTQDGGHFIGWANMFWPIRSPERMVMVGTAYQTIGLGFGTVPGVAAAAPSSTVVLSTGDGGGLMGLADLETAIRTAWSCVIVVWNDSAYGAEVHLYGVMGLDDEPMRIPNVDFAALARSLGAEGVRVESLEDLSALERWVDAGRRGTILLDCQISQKIVAQHQLEIQRVNGVNPHP